MRQYWNAYHGQRRRPRWIASIRSYDVPFAYRMKKILSRVFFERPTIHVARELLGKFLARRHRGSTIVAMIADVEAYDGFRDRGSHASRGRTTRNAPMFGPPGHWYVYFTYGMHWMLNIVTREEGYPAAILIRGIQGANGPARLTKKLKIGGRMNGERAEQRSGLWIEDRGVRIRRSEIKSGPRIGVSYAGPYWAQRRLRFWISPNPLRRAAALNVAGRSARAALSS